MVNKKEKIVYGEMLMQLHKRLKQRIKYIESGVIARAEDSFYDDKNTYRQVESIIDMIEKMEKAKKLNARLESSIMELCDRSRALIKTLAISNTSVRNRLKSQMACTLNHRSTLYRLIDKAYCELFDIFFEDEKSFESFVIEYRKDSLVSETVIYVVKKNGAISLFLDRFGRMMSNDKKYGESKQIDVSI